MRSTRYTTTSEYLDALERMIRTAGDRVAVADPEDLAMLVALHDAVDAAILVAVAGLKRDFSWESLGRATGTSAPAAFMKWRDRMVEEG